MNTWALSHEPKHRLRCPEEHHSWQPETVLHKCRVTYSTNELSQTLDAASRPMCQTQDAPCVSQHKSPDKVGFHSQRVLFWSRRDMVWMRAYGRSLQAAVSSIAWMGGERRAEGASCRGKRRDVSRGWPQKTCKVQRHVGAPMRLEVPEREPCCRVIKVAFTVTAWHTPSV